MLVSPLPIPLFYSDAHAAHAPDAEYFHNRILDYPEKPRRAQAIYEHLTQNGLAQPIAASAPLAAEIISQTHAPEMVAALAKASAEIDRLIQPPAPFFVPPDPDASRYYYPSIFPTRAHMQNLRKSANGQIAYYFFDANAPIGAATYEAAAYSAAVAYDAAAYLLASDGGSIAYALCRPPGHHAGYDYMGGYCYFNNAAIAAKRLAQVGRVALIDVDYHHGNGSQDIFWDDPQVFFGSIHADPNIEYPYITGFAEETGGANAPNLNLNIPLPVGTDGAAFLHALDVMLARVLDFAPSALIVSLGFDTYVGDETCTFAVEAEAYNAMGARLAALDLPTLIVQEGGYNAEANPLLLARVLSDFIALRI